MPYNQYVFKGDLRFHTALHIGGGTLNETNTDSPIMKTPDGVPFIPGSSLKGAFRSFVERVVSQTSSRSSVERVVSQISSLRTCQLNDEYGECLSTDKTWSTKKKNGEQKTEDQIVRELNGEVEVKGIAGLCHTCQLFGSPHRASKVFFADANIVEGEWAEMTQVRDGVVINRDSGTAVTNLKYDYEVLPTGSLFRVEVVAKDVSLTDLGMLAIGLNELLAGHFLLGGQTTRGLGSCQLQNLDILISDWEDPKQFKQYLLGHTRDEKYAKTSGREAGEFLMQKTNYLFAEKEN